MSIPEQKCRVIFGKAMAHVVRQHSGTNQVAMTTAVNR